MFITASVHAAGPVPPAVIADVPVFAAVYPRAAINLALVF